MIDRSHLWRFTAAVAAAALAAGAFAGCSSSPEKGAAPAAKQGAARGPSRSFETVRRDPPIAAETRFAAGQLAEGNGHFAAAVEQYRKALELDPKHDRAMFHLGVVLAEMKKYPEAVAVWRRYAKLTNESPRAHSNLGFCYELAGRLDEAEAAYQKGIRRDGSDVACRVNYGLMLARRGRVGEAKIQLGAVLKPAEVHYNLGSVHESAGRREQARAEYQAALALDPGFTDAIQRLDDLAPASSPAAAGPVSTTN